MVDERFVTARELSYPKVLESRCGPIAILRLVSPLTPGSSELGMSYVADVRRL